MFEHFYSPENVAKTLVPQSDYHPFPRCGEAVSLTPEQKEAMIRAGEPYLGYEWPVATAMAYTKFITEGTRVPYEMTNYRSRRNALCLLMDAEYAEGKGRFLNDIINGMWAIMDEATWVVPAHNGGWELPNFDKPVIIDLFSAGTAGMLANAYYLFKKQIDAVSPLILRRLEIVMEERIFAPFMQNIYWWSGMAGRKTNNWNPWILSNILTCFGLMCKNQLRRAEAIARCALMLDKFLEVYTIDGGCDEGPSYWGAAGACLFDCLSEMSKLTAGATDIYFDELLIQNIGRYIYRAHIAGSYFTNYADAPKEFRASGDLIYRYGKAIKDQSMMDLGVALFNLYKKMDAENPGNPDVVRADVHHHYRHMESVIGLSEMEAAQDHGFPLLEHVFIDGIQLVAERQKGGSTDGLYLSAKGGHNDESHNHNDVGTFILYSDGVPSIVDIGSGLYNAKTFSAQRYEIPQMQSSYHNLPEINGVMQHAGEQYTARDVSYVNENDVTVFSEDIAAAYPEEAGVTTWRRTFTFDRIAQAVTIHDEATFAADDNRVETMFIVPNKPEIADQTAVLTQPGARAVELTCEGAELTAEEVDLTYDPRLTELWNGHVWRIHAAAKPGKTFAQTFILKQK